MSLILVTGSDHMSTCTSLDPSDVLARHPDWCLYQNPFGWHAQHGESRMGAADLATLDWMLDEQDRLRGRAETVVV